MAYWILGEEGAIGPAGLKPLADVLNILSNCRPRSRITKRRHCRVSPQAFQIGGAGISWCGQCHVVNIVNKGETRLRIGSSIVTEPVLHFRYNFCAFCRAQRERSRRTTDHDNSDGDSAFKISARWPRRCLGQRGGAFTGRGYGGAAAFRDVPRLALARPVGLYLLVFRRYTQLEGAYAKGFGLG